MITERQSMAGRVWLGVTKQGYINETEEGLVGGEGLDNVNVDSN